MEKGDVFYSRGNFSWREEAPSSKIKYILFLLNYKNNVHVISIITEIKKELNTDKMLYWSFLSVHLRSYFWGRKT